MWNTPYELFIGLRYLKARKKQAFISVISFISISGVAIGVMALIIVLGVITGFSDDLRNKILGAKSHLVIYQLGMGIPDYREVIRRVTSIPGVVSATPAMLNQVMITSSSNTVGPMIKGIEAATERAEALIAIAHPGFREELRAAARRRNLLQAPTTAVPME